MRCSRRRPHRGGKRNFLFIITDDHGYGDVSTYERRDVLTPNIDWIAGQPKIAREMEITLRGHIQRGGAVPWQKPDR